MSCHVVVMPVIRECLNNALTDLDWLTVLLIHESQPSEQM